MTELSSAEIGVRITYWIESGGRSAFPSDAIGRQAWSGNRDLGTIVGGCFDDCLALIKTTTHTCIARRVDFFGAMPAGGDR